MLVLEAFARQKFCSSARTNLSVSPSHLSITFVAFVQASTSALDVWSAGTILMCILACKFPIFTAGDDVEALMELAAVYGRKTMEKCGKLHSK